MTARRVFMSFGGLSPPVQVRSRIGSRLWAPSCHGHHSLAATTRSRPLSTPSRPRRQRSAATVMGPLWAVSRRTIFIQNQSTPNPDALKFLPNSPILPPNFPTTFVEYTSPRSTLRPPYTSSLAAKLLAVEGVSSVFYGSDFITVTKTPEAQWPHLKPEVFSLITEALTSGEEMVKKVETTEPEHTSSSDPENSLVSKDGDSEVVQMIKELLETRIRPAIQEDGGDIEYRGFEDGRVLLKLRGACRTCDSSTVTLKNGIENMLMHYIEEVRGVHQVLDQEEEMALKEFEAFEAKLSQQRARRANAAD